MKGTPFIISAPSGAGKSTLIRGLRGRVPDLGFSVSHTTRAPRTGEVDGVQYHFVDRPAFEALRRDGQFAEWAEVHGNLYGTSFSSLEASLSQGTDVLLDIDVQGALQIAERFPDAVLIFILPPSWGELRRRLEDRGLDAVETVERRISNARGELSFADRYRYIVPNDDLESAVSELESIVRAERCRTARRRDWLDHLTEFVPRAAG